MRGWRPWTVQPPPGTPIDWDSPLAEGLVDVIEMYGLPRSKLLGTPATPYGSTKFGIAAPSGMSFDTLAGGGATYFSRTDSAYGPSQQTFVFVGQFHDFPKEYSGVFGTGTTSQNSIFLQYSGTPGSYFVEVGSGGNHAISIPFSLDTPLVLSLASSANTSAYVNGGLASTLSGVGPLATAGAFLNIGGEKALNSSYTSEFECAAFYFYNRELSEERNWKIGTNPWQIFHRRRRAYSIPTSSGAAGTAAITEGSDTAAATGNLAIPGTASITEASDTVAATGALAIAGTAAITEGSDTVTATGVGGEVGTAAIAESSDTVSATGALSVTGTAAITESDDTVSATGALSVTGSAGITEGTDTVAATGAAGSGATAAITEQPDTASATGAIAVSGAAAIFEGGDIVVASGALGLAGSASITEAPDSVAATGSGPQPANPMPNFIGFPINYVIQILAAQGLAASLTYQIADPPGTTMGLITAQSPAPGQQLKAPVSFTCTGAIALPAVGVRSGNVPALLVGNNDNPGGRSTNS